MTFIELLYRTCIIFLLLFSLARLLGRKLISQMTFFDFISGITLGSLSANITLSKEFNFKVMIIAPIIFMLLSLLLGFLSTKSLKARKWINSEPVLVIRSGEILKKNMKKIRLTSDALLMLLRKKNIFYLNEVDYAIMETDGTLSVLKNSKFQTTTRKDLNLPNNHRGFPHIFISDGRVLNNELAKLNKEQGWIDTVLESRGIHSLDDVFLAQIDENGEIEIM